jgi:predicted nucleotidyltransferase
LKDLILQRLNEIETTENVVIFYACESGSRAWGFPSADSDYDVRFLYLRPQDWYLSIQEKRDVIERELENNLDVNGWDLKKALNLLLKSNPPLLEWLGSPIVYQEKFNVAEKMRELAKIYYSPAACMYHYLHMARGNFREYLKGDQVWHKKYFYVLRPILAIQWIEKGYGIAPTAFGNLVSRMVTDPVLTLEINKLIEAKKQGAELDKGPRIAAISDFIERELERWDRDGVPFHAQHIPIDQLDSLFRDSLEEIWQTKV